jgi:hypothetical protein
MKTKYALKTPSMMKAGRSMIQKRIGALIIALLLGVCPSAFAQYTPMPHPLIQWFTNAGAVANGYGLCVFRAGTTTLATTYATSTGTANTNPILMNSAGRAVSGGVFLVPGESYKFVYKDDSVTTCVPDTGVTLFTVDNVSAVPGSASSVDVSSATAGESIAAGDAVFLSNGSNSLNAGQWYRTDSDFTYKSTAVAMVGIAPSAITSGASGSVRIAGATTVTGPLSTGAAYYVGATPGAIVTTPPTNAIRLGVAQSATSLVIGFTAAPVGPRGPPCGRLTLTTGLPVTTADVTGASATTLYYAPYGGCNQIDLFDGTTWARNAFAQISIAVPATTSQMYDVFAYDNAGVVALELTAWTNDTTRATALVDTKRRVCENWRHDAAVSRLLPDDDGERANRRQPGEAVCLQLLQPRTSIADEGRHDRELVVHPRHYSAGAGDGHESGRDCERRGRGRDFDLGACADDELDEPRGGARNDWRELHHGRRDGGRRRE